ncbi:protein SLOW GREEN 1, chloroplastic [Rhodamnia argentea]|uniref:Protein SLOW GREEN 1, chloroplastic n=1 Tax=Rhodamnia argentea TaxID=178133 RepID=A0ABM3HJL1_9MYRT|nr:protein SLOW GREEN 1, chloroplastic [Rhodamnia argentea]
MNSTLSSSSTFNFTKPPSFALLSRPPPSILRFPTPKPQEDSSLRRNTIRACSVADSGNPPKNPILQKLQNCAGAAVLVGAAVSFVFSSEKSAARAVPPPANVETEQSPSLEEIQGQVQEGQESQPSPLTELLGSDPESVDAMRKLLQQKLESGEDQEALKILRRLVAAQPEVTEWKFLLARLLGEIGDTENARKVFEEILAANPLSFEALFENALLMDRCGEGEAVIKRLDEALRIAEEENKAKEARDVRLIMAQIQFLQKNVEGALKSYQDLAKEDPTDFRPYFCQGMIYSLLDKNAEAREQFAKYRELSPKKFDVEGYLRTPLSRMKLFGTDEAN